MLSNVWFFDFKIQIKSIFFIEILDALNPVYLIIIGCLIAAGCAFELAYGTKGSSGRTTWSHVASRQQPYSVTQAWKYLKNTQNLVKNIEKR